MDVMNKLLEEGLDQCGSHAVTWIQMREHRQCQAKCTVGGLAYVGGWMDGWLDGGLKVVVVKLMTKMPIDGVNK